MSWKTVFGVWRQVDWAPVLVNILLAMCPGPVTSPLEPGFFLWKMGLVIIHIHLRVDGNMTC